MEDVSPHASRHRPTTPVLATGVRLGAFAS